MKTPSLWYVDRERVELRDVEIPELSPNDALVEVETCGVCTWDLFIFSGGFQSEKPYPFYFGHEGVGHVARIGNEVRSLRPGQRVALRESPEIGRTGTGHMARLAVLPERMLIPLPESSLPGESWLVEPVACCVNAIDRAAVRVGERVALVGSGFMGSILLQGLLQTPHAELAVFDVNAVNLAKAQAIGAGRPLKAIDPRTVAQDAGDLAGRFDLVVETAAAEPGFRLADKLVRRGGRLVCFSWHHHPFEIDLGRWHVRGITVLNVSPSANPHFDDCFHQAIAMIEAGKLDVGSLVTHVASPRDAQPLFEKGLRKTDGYLKGAIRWA